MMKKASVTTKMMMEMCMWTCCMCMTVCAYISDVFSILKVDHCAA